MTYQKDTEIALTELLVTKCKTIWISKEVVIAMNYNPLTKTGIYEISLL